MSSFGRPGSRNGMQSMTATVETPVSNSRVAGNLRSCSAERSVSKVACVETWVTTIASRLKGVVFGRSIATRITSRV